jgi:hypothetical protein
MLLMPSSARSRLDGLPKVSASMARTVWCRREMADQRAERNVL